MDHDTGDKDDDGGALACAVDLVSGSALPLLYMLYSLGSGDAMLGLAVTLGGGAVAVVVSAMGRGLLLAGGGPCTVSAEWARALGEVMQLVGAALRAALSAAQLFTQAGALDPDVGAGLYAIPMFALLSLQGVPRNRGDVSARTMVAVLSVLVLAFAWLTSVYSTTAAALRPGAPLPGALRGEGGWWWYALLLFSSAFAYSDLHPGGSAGPAAPQEWYAGWPAFAIRGAAFACLSLTPRVLSLLLTERQPRWLFVLQNVLLIHSAILQSTAARRLLFGLRLPAPLDGFRVEHPQRTLMVWLAPVLAAAYAFQWRDPLDAATAVFVFAALRVALWALHRPGASQ